MYKFHHFRVKEVGSKWVFYSANHLILHIDYDGVIRFADDVTFDFYDLGLIREFIRKNVKSMKGF